jgi:hypothetical protein
LNQKECGWKCWKFLNFIYSCLFGIHYIMNISGLFEIVMFILISIEELLNVLGIFKLRIILSIEKWGAGNQNKSDMGKFLREKRMSFLCSGFNNMSKLVNVPIFPSVLFFSIYSSSFLLIFWEIWLCILNKSFHESRFSKFPGVRAKSDTHWDSLRFDKEENDSLLE